MQKNIMVLYYDARSIPPDSVTQTIEKIQKELSDKLSKENITVLVIPVFNEYDNSKIEFIHNTDNNEVKS